MSVLPPTSQTVDIVYNRAGFTHKVSRLMEIGKIPELDFPATQDLVEISDVSQAKSFSYSFMKSAEERQALYDQIREELEKLSSQRKDINSQINEALKKNGIKLSPSDKLRIEVSGGKIYAGGIKDKETRKAVEDALNEEKDLSNKISQCKSTKNKVSSLLSSETGATLDDLAQASIGKDNKRDGVTIQLVGSAELDQYSLFANHPDLVDLIRENAEPSIILDSSSRAISNPEATLTEGLENAWRKIDEIFNAINDELVEKLKSTGALKDPDFDKEFLMNLGRVKITVNSDGGIEITGKVADDSLTDRKGKEIIEEVMREMMNEPDDSGLFTPFAEATQRLLEDYQLEYGAEAAADALVEMEIGAGASSPSGAVRLASPSKEAELLEGIISEVNAILGDLGIESEDEGGFEVEVDSAGKISIINLPESEFEREKALAALALINTAVKTAGEDDPTYGGLAKLLAHNSVFQWGGTYALHGDEDK